MNHHRRRLGSSLLAAGLLLGERSALAAPTILQPPQSITVTAGATAGFNVSANGNGPLHYDWRRDGVSLEAADTASYSTPPAVLADGGAVFTVVVSDSAGTTPSPNAYLTVNPAAPSPFATWAAAIADPTQRGPLASPRADGLSNLLKYTLGIAPHAAPALGQLPSIARAGTNTVFHYNRDPRATGIAVVVEQSATLSAGSWSEVTASQIADDGVNERWEATVPTGTARAFYRLSISIKDNVVPALTTQPAGTSTNPGGTPTFTVAATGTGPLRYQWRKNGALIPGATAASYTPPPLTTADNGARFSVLVSGEAGTVASSEALVAVAAAADINALVAEVSLARYTANLRDRLFTHLGDNRGTLPNGSPSPQLLAARDLLIQHYTTCGFSVTTETFTSHGFTRTNIIATRLGTVRPGELVIVGAHYDSVGNPGANDNGSGTAAIMEVAQVMGARTFESTLRLIAFDDEEGILIGSSAYVAAHPHDNVRCMLNVDTIGQDGGDHKLCIDSSDHLAMEQQVAAAMGRYGDGIVTVVRQTGDCSDHLSFENAGSTACEVYNNDWWEYGDPHNHQATDSVDTPGYINYAFATKVTRGVVGFLAEQAVLVAIE